MREALRPSYVWDPFVRQDRLVWPAFILGRDPNPFTVRFSIAGLSEPVSGRDGCAIRWVCGLHSYHEQVADHPQLADTRRRNDEG